MGTACRQKVVQAISFTTDISFRTRHEHSRRPSERAPRRDVFDRAAVKALFDLPRETLFARADAVRKDNMGDEVFLRGIVEFSNICANDCLYCGIRKSNRDVRRYRIDEEEILEVAHRMEGWQQTTIVLQSGEVAAEKEDERIERIIRRIKTETRLAVTMSAGNRPRDTYARWRAAGMDRYLLRFETSNPELFAYLHPDCDLDERIRCLKICAAWVSRSAPAS